MTRSEQLRAEAAALEAKATELETQLSRADLKDMTPHAIEQARVDGRLDNLLAGTIATTKEN